MDCDDVMLMLAAREQRPLTGLETTKFDVHVAGCNHCQSLTTETVEEDDWRWLVRVPSDALDDDNLLVLPVVDPVVFSEEKELASGGMGRITRAHDRRLGRDVAIKEVLEPDLRARFEREVAITARLQHPAIVPIYEAGTFPNGSTFYTMRLVPGGTLATALERATTLAKRLALLPHLRAMTDALAYAHSRHVIHRDLKPSNVLIGEYGETIVIDWGLAKELDRDEGEVPSPISFISNPELTHVGSVIGTPCYMSPEQAAGKDVDERDDVYALGALLYHVLTGRPPYWDPTNKQTATMIIEATLTGPPEPIEKLAPEVPPDLRAIAERAMARDKSRRFPTAKEMAEELHRFEAGQLLVSRQYSTRELIARWLRRHRTAVTVGGIALVALLATGIAAFIDVTQSRADEQVARVKAEESALTAERAQVRGEATVLSLLEEQGRTELLDGERHRALAYLSEAYARGHDTPAMRHLLAGATRDLDLLRYDLDSEMSGSPEVAVMADGTIVTYGQRLYITRPPQPYGLLARWKHGKLVDKRVNWVDLDDVTFDQGATRIAGVGKKQEVGIWDVTTGANVWTAPGPFENIDLWLTPTGHLLIAHEKPTLELRDKESGKILATAQLTTTPDSVAFSRDGALFATEDETSTVRVFDARTLRPVASVQVKDEPNVVMFLGARSLVIGTKSPTAHLWSIGQPATSPLFGGHYSSVLEVATNVGGNMVVTGDARGTVRLWTASGTLLGESHELRGEVSHLAFSPDGEMIAGCGLDTRVMFWDTTLSLIGTAPAFDLSGQDLHWTMDSTQLVTGDLMSASARVWARPAGSRIARFPSDRSRVAGNRVIVGLQGDLVVRDIVTGAVTSRLENVSTKGKSTWFDLSRDGKRALIWDGDKHVVVDMIGHSPLKTHMGEVTFSPDGEFVVIEEKAKLRVLDAATAQELVVASHEWDTPVGGFSNDGRYFVASTTDMFRLWDMRTLALIPTPLAAPATEASILAFDASGERLVWADWDEAKLLDVASGATIATFKPREGRIRFPKLDRASHRFVAQANLVVSVWNVADGRLLFSVDGVNDDAFALTSDGNRLATGTSDGAVRIWDVATGRLLEVLRGHRDRIDSIAFNDDATRLVVASYDQTTTIWDVSVEQRSPAAIRSLADRTSWQITGGALVRKAK